MVDSELQIQQLRNLRTLILNHFNLEELRTLCLDLGVDYESLSGDSKPTKVRELIHYHYRVNRVKVLLYYLNEARPTIAWPQIEDLPETLAYGQQVWEEDNSLRGCLFQVGHVKLVLYLLIPILFAFVFFGLTGNQQQNGALGLQTVQAVLGFPSVTPTSITPTSTPTLIPTLIPTPTTVIIIQTVLTTPLPTATPSATPSLLGSVTGNVNLYPNPDGGGEVITFIPTGTQVTILGRSFQGQFVLLQTAETTGYGSGDFVQLPLGMELEDLPIVDSIIVPTRPIPTSTIWPTPLSFDARGTALALEAATLFNTPNAVNDSTLPFIIEGEFVDLLAQDSTGRWLYIRHENGDEGFVWEEFFEYPAGLDLPIVNTD